MSRHVSANSKPSSGVVAHRILKVSNHLKNSNGSVESVLKLFLAIIFASDIFVLTTLTTAIAKNNFSTDSTDPLELFINQG
jgi:hypothetical protein